MLKTLARQKTSRQFTPPPRPSTTPLDWLPALKVAHADALWTLTPTAQLPFTENAAASIFGS